MHESIARSWSLSWPAVIALVLALAPLSNINASSGAGLAVVGMDVRVELRPDHGLIEETARITIEGSSGPVVRFRLNRSLLVESSRTGSGAVSHSQAGDTVSVTLTPPLDNERRTLTFRIAGRPRHQGEDRITARGVVLGAVDHWIPTLETTMAEVDLQVVAPAGWSVLGSGEPSPRSSGDVHRFRSRRAVRSVGLAAAPDRVMTTSVLGKTPLRVAGSEADDAADLAKVLSDPLTWLSGTVAPYPFEGLSLAFMPGLDSPVYAGGFIAVPQDHSLTSLGDGADLLASLWFGQYLAGDGPWVESLAAWQATSYTRDRGLGIPSRIVAQRDRYRSMSSNRDVAIRRSGDDTPLAVTRGKGSAAWEMIRLTCGNRHFRTGLESLVAAAPGPPLQLKTVRERFATGSAEPVETVFADWFDRTGLPRLTTRLQTFPTSREDWRTDLTIDQGGRPYTLTLDVVFHGAGEEHRETVRIDRETTQLLYVLPFQAIRVELDPLGRIFKQPTITRKR